MIIPIICLDPILSFSFKLLLLWELGSYQYGTSTTDLYLSYIPFFLTCFEVKHKSWYGIHTSYEMK